jgi:hypothetical protein
MKRHPEQQENEKFLGNFTKATYHLIAWHTKRIGTIAYFADISRGPITGNFEPKLYPVFVQLSEVEGNKNE